MEKHACGKSSHSEINVYDISARRDGAKPSVPFSVYVVGVCIVCRHQLVDLLLLCLSLVTGATVASACVIVISLQQVGNDLKNGCVTCISILSSAPGFKQGKFDLHKHETSHWFIHGI